MRLQKNIIHGLTVCLCIANGCFAAVPPEKNWTLTFEDNFNTLNTNQWHIQDQVERRRGWNYSNNVFAANGNLVIRTMVQEGRYTTGFLSTSSEDESQWNTFFIQPYGYFEARIKASTESGQWSAFWLMPQGGRVDHSGRDGCELDIVELAHNNGIVDCAMHFDGYESNRQGRAAQIYVGNVSEFHTYGFQWSPGKYTWYIDDQIVWEETDPEWISQVEEYILITTEIGDCWGGNIENATLPCYTYFDYVRAYTNSGASGQAARPSPIYGEELVVNGDFENGTADWVSEDTTLSSVTSPRQEGSKALRVGGRDLSWHTPSQNILAGLKNSGDGHFAYRGWIQVPSGSADGVFGFSFKEHDEWIYKNALRNIRTTNWTKISGVFYLPVESVQDASVAFRTTDTQDYYIDGLTVTPVAFGGTGDAAEKTKSN